MTGDVKLAAKVKGTNTASEGIAMLLQKMADKLDRDWSVQLDDGGANQKSHFIASDTDVTLVLRRSDLVSASASGVLKNIVVTQVVDGEVEAHLYEILANDLGLYGGET